VGISDATAKNFGPGDLRLCGAGRCVSIKDRGVLRAFSSFYYGGPRPGVVDSPRRGAPAFQLRFRNGYVSGIAGGARLDRMLLYGVNCGRFQRGTWYRLPRPLALWLRELAAPLQPLRVNPRAIPWSC
jgi:hypothetical protein